MSRLKTKDLSDRWVPPASRPSALCRHTAGTAGRKRRLSLAVAVALGLSACGDSGGMLAASNTMLAEAPAADAGLVCVAGASCVPTAAAASVPGAHAADFGTPGADSTGKVDASKLADGGGPVGPGTPIASTGVASTQAGTPPTVNQVFAGGTTPTPPGFSPPQSVVVSSARRWSDPSTWGGRLPSAGAAVVIPAGMRVLLDQSTPSLAAVTVNGELEFEPGSAVELIASKVVVSGMGTLRAGTPAQRFTGRVTVTLTGDVAADTDPMGTRGIQVVAGGKLLLYGTPPAVPWTRLNDHAEAGATRLVLERPVDWKAGDTIAVAPTEWYPDTNAPQATQNGWATTEQRRLSASAAGSTLTLDSGLSSFKWGRLQYITDGGMSLVRGTFTPPHPEAADTLDERAEVGNLTRNIVIQGVDDAQWRDRGFGAHVMVMDRASQLQFDGVELRRVGQAGKVGRYPIHWHLLSYGTDGSFLGDAEGHYVRNSTIWNSRQRCMVIHGTNGIELRGNICYDIRGHAVFLEDAVERRNVLEGNLVMKVRSPASSEVIVEHERAGNMCGASAGYWLTNPDNTVRGNAVADAQGNGFWLSYPRRPVKQGARVPLRPQNLPHAPFERNSARSNGNAGVMLECAMTDDAGNLETLYYSPTVDGSPLTNSNGVRFEIREITTAKNRTGYINRAINPDYVRWVAADNLTRAFTGAVMTGSTLTRSLIVGNSLNNGKSRPAGEEPQLGAASYHSTLDVANNTFVSFANLGDTTSTLGEDLPSGAFGTDDLYLRAVERGTVRNANNRLIQSDPGHRTLPPHLRPEYSPASRNNWTMAGAVWDPHGYWGAPGRYLVYDHPFLRDGTCAAVFSRLPAGQPNGLSCAGPYFAFADFALNRGFAGSTWGSSFLETIDVSRIDAAGNTIGRWRVEQGYTSTFLGNMRHFAAVQGDTYVLRFPEFPNASTTKSAPRWVQLMAENFTEAGHAVMLGIHFDGGTVPSKVSASTNPDYPMVGFNTRLLSPTSSRAQVAAGDGSTYWQDRANNLVWVKVVPLGFNLWSSFAPSSDEALYKRFALRIES